MLCGGRGWAGCGGHVQVAWHGGGRKRLLVMCTMTESGWGGEARNGFVGWEAHRCGLVVPWCAVKRCGRVMWCGGEGVREWRCEGRGLRP